jgi:hypothetical protein
VESLNAENINSLVELSAAALRRHALSESPFFSLLRLVTRVFREDCRVELQFGRRPRKLV